MELYRTDDGQEFELPTMTPKLRAKQDRVASAATNTEREKAQLDFVRECLPKEYVDAAIGKRYDDTDLVALGIAFVGINDAYSKPLREAQAAAFSGQLDSMQPVMDIIDTASKITQANNAGVRQAFKVVK